MHGNINWKLKPLKPVEVLVYILIFSRIYQVTFLDERSFLKDL